MPSDQSPQGAAIVWGGKVMFAWGNRGRVENSYAGSLGINNLTLDVPRPTADQAWLIRLLDPGNPGLAALSSHEEMAGVKKWVTTGSASMRLDRNNLLRTCGWNNNAEVKAPADTAVGGHPHFFSGPNEGWYPFNFQTPGPTDISGGGTWAGTPRFSMINGFWLMVIQGDVYCVGYNADGVYGNGTTTWITTATIGVPNVVKTWDHTSMGASAIAVHAGARHSVVLDNLGRVWTAGNNTYGQLGRGAIGTNSASWGLIAAPSGGRTYIGIAAGPKATLLVVSDGTVMACGDSTQYQLGPGIQALPSSRVGSPTAIAGLSNIAEAMQVGFISWFRTNDGKLYCHGIFTWDDVGFTQPQYLMDTDGINQYQAAAFAPQQILLDWVSPGTSGPYTPRSPQVITCAKLSYASGECDLAMDGGQHFPAYSVIGSDGKLYCWGGHGLGMHGDGVTGTNPLTHDRNDIFEASTTFTGVTASTIGMAIQFVCADGRVTRYDSPLWTGGDAKVFRYASIGGAAAEPTSWEQPTFVDTTWIAPIAHTPQLTRGVNYDPLLTSTPTGNQADVEHNPIRDMSETVWCTAAGDEEVDPAAGGMQTRMLSRWRFIPPAESLYNLSPGFLMRLSDFAITGTGPAMLRDSARFRGSELDQYWVNGTNDPFNPSRYFNCGVVNTVAARTPILGIGPPSDPLADLAIWTRLSLIYCYISAVPAADFPLPVVARGRSWAQIVGD